MKVLFLTRYPESGASSRYRVYQYLPHLESLGIECQVSPFMSESMYRAAFEPGGHFKKFGQASVATIRRLSWLFRANRFDLLFLQRECLPFGGAWMESIFPRYRPTIFDLDDALFISKPSRFNKVATFFRNPNKYFDIFRKVDCVLAGNSWLAKQAAEYCDDARAFHVAEDTNRIPMRPPHNNDDGVTLGWLGSKSTEKYLELIREPLESLTREFDGLRLKVVGGGDFRSDSIEVVHRPWKLDTEIAELCSFDIGLMPLPNEPWSQGKSGGKARTYMAAGVPPVATAIGYNRELIATPSLGRLIDSDSEWISALRELIAKPGLRQEIGECARMHVEKFFAVQSQAKLLAEIFEEITCKKLAKRSE